MGELEIVIKSEVSQKEKDRYHIILLICEIYKMVQMNLFAMQKDRHRCREQVYDYKGGREGGINWETVIDIDNLSDGSVVKNLLAVQEVWL